MSFLSRLKAVAYNLDRAIASAAGAPDQATISSEAGEAAARGKWWGRVLCWGLDKIQPGHCAHARKHTDKLEGADDGFVG